MSNRSNLLINEYPLIVLPTLAQYIGLNEAIILQQIQYWCKNFEASSDTKHYKDGKWWVYNSISDWKKNFPFWSERTIIRAIENLKEYGLIITGNYNSLPFDRTLWYTIDYEKLDRVASNWQNPSCQNDKMDDDNLTSPIPETNSETNTEEKENTGDGNDEIGIFLDELEAIFEQKTGIKVHGYYQGGIDMARTFKEKGITAQDFAEGIDEGLRLGYSIVRPTSARNITMSLYNKKQATKPPTRVYRDPDGKLVEIELK